MPMERFKMSRITKRVRDKTFMNIGSFKRKADADRFAELKRYEESDVRVVKSLKTKEWILWERI